MPVIAHYSKGPQLINITHEEVGGKTGDKKTLPPPGGEGRGSKVELHPVSS